MAGEIAVLLITIGGQRYALDAREVSEVLPFVEHRRAGTGPAWLLGLFNLRGRLVPLVDLAMIVDGTGAPRRMASRIVVMRLEEGLFDGQSGEGRPIGLLVPEVTGTAEIAFDAPGAHEGFSFAGAPHLGPTAVDREGMVQLLRCRRLLEGDAALRELPVRTEP